MFDCLAGSVAVMASVAVVDSPASCLSTRSQTQWYPWVAASFPENTGLSLMKHAQIGMAAWPELDSH